MSSGTSLTAPRRRVARRSDRTPNIGPDESPRTLARRWLSLTPQLRDVSLATHLNTQSIDIRLQTLNDVFGHVVLTQIMVAIHFFHVTLIHLAPFLRARFRQFI